MESQAEKLTEQRLHISELQVMLYSKVLITNALFNAQLDTLNEKLETKEEEIEKHSQLLQAAYAKIDDLTKELNVIKGKGV